MAKFPIKPALNFLLAEKRDDLSVRQLSILIACKKQQTVRGLAQEFGINRPAITRGADKLEEVGFLKRDIDPEDKRSVYLSLTPAGAAFAAHFS